MNQNPHTHELTVRMGRYNNHLIVIEYGDQTGYVRTRYPGWRKRLERKIQKTIQKHDEASRVAHLEPEAVVKTVQEQYNEALIQKTGRYPYKETMQAWGSEIVKEKGDQGNREAEPDVQTDTAGAVGTGGPRVDGPLVQAIPRGRVWG